MWQETAPAANPWLNPSVLVPLGLAAIAFIAWLVRLEYKTNATERRQGEHEEFMDERVNKVEGNLDKVKAAHYSHAGDARVHHNEEAFSEFRRGLDEKFLNLNTKLGEIKSLITSRNANRDK